MKGIVEVALALILDGDKILIGRRPSHKPLPHRWEFPGGKIEPGETPEECVVREIREEFGVTVAIIRPFLVWEYEYGPPVSIRFRLTSFLCGKPEGELHPTDHDAFGWIPVAMLDRYDILEADKVVSQKLLEFLNNEEKTA